MPEPDAPARILLIVAHPALERARLNPALVEAAAAAPGVTVRDLYELYPDFTVDVRTEQQLLLEHDAVVLHFPLYWYSAPALLKEWLDAVWLHGFAYGPQGPALAGKRLLCAVSTGAGAAEFTPEGTYGHTVDEFLRPFEAAARYCGLVWSAPFVVHARDALAPGGGGVQGAVEAYRARLEALAAEVAAGRTEA